MSRSGSDPKPHYPCPSYLHQIRNRWSLSCNCTFIYQVVLTRSRRQRRAPLFFESSSHLSTCLPHAVEAFHCPFHTDQDASLPFRRDSDGIVFHIYGGWAGLRTFCCIKAVVNENRLCILNRVCAGLAGLLKEITCTSWSIGKKITHFKGSLFAMFFFIENWLKF